MIIQNLTQLTKQKNEYNLLAGGIVTFLALFYLHQRRRLFKFFHPKLR